MLFLIPNFAYFQFKKWDIGGRLVEIILRKFKFIPVEISSIYVIIVL